jgi:hypothetical protein
MHSSDAWPRTAPPHELCFLLRVRPARHESPWQAELTAPDGSTSAFGTPIDLLRHLAGMEATVRRHGGLR